MTYDIRTKLFCRHVDQYKQNQYSLCNCKQVLAMSIAGVIRRLVRGHSSGKGKSSSSRVAPGLRPMSRAP
jgi:hypothetical protein